MTTKTATPKRIPEPPREHEVRMDGRTGARWAACSCGWKSEEFTQKGAVSNVFYAMAAHTGGKVE